MRRVLRKHLTDVVALVALVVVAVAVGLYILNEQRMRFPFLDPEPKTLKFELSTAQAVTPGQGQTVRVSGVRIGDISDVDLERGRAIVTTDIDDEWDDLVRTDATALLRPKTGLKDMFIELRPGRGPVAPDGFTIPIGNTLPDVNPDEILAALDTDTRDYLKLLLQGGARGLDGRAGDLRDVLRLFEPTHRDLARVSGAVASRRTELRRLVTSLAEVNEELAGRDDDLARLVRVSASTFRQLASERDSLEQTVELLPNALSRSTAALRQVDALAREIPAASTALRPVARKLTEANEALAPAQAEAAPLLVRKIRPLVREARPLVRRLEPAAGDLVESEPGLVQTLASLNSLFNMLGYNQNGREAPGKAGRSEGYLFDLAWLSHQATNVFSSADAHGPFRAITLGGTCGTLRGVLGVAPQLETLLGLSGVLTDPKVCG